MSVVADAAYDDGMAVGRIIIGDFRDYLDMPQWQDAVVISDPPYNQGYHYDAYRDRLHEDDYADLLRAAFLDRRAVVIHYPEETVNVLGPILGQCDEVVSWVYPSNTSKQSRLITWWGCRPDMRRVGQPYKNPNDKRIRERIKQGKEARLYDWWNVNQVKNVSKANNPHPCPIPYEIARRIILTTTDPGDTVIDPFCGSGTVVQAAIDSGRHGLGFDVDSKYADHAAGRILTPIDETTKPSAERLAPVCGACSGCYDPDPDDCGQAEGILGVGDKPGITAATKIADTGTLVTQNDNESGTKSQSPAKCPVPSRIRIPLGAPPFPAQSKARG